MIPFAWVAQLVELLFCKQVVVGSNPSPGPIVSRDAIARYQELGYK